MLQQSITTCQASFLYPRGDEHIVLQVALYRLWNQDRTFHKCYEPYRQHTCQEKDRGDCKNNTKPMGM